MRASSIRFRGRTYGRRVAAVKRRPGRRARLGPLGMSSAVERGEARREARLEWCVARVAREVRELVRVAPQVVQLAPAVAVLDPEPARRAERPVRRRAAVPVAARTEVLLHERVPPRRRLTLEQRDEAAAVLREAGPDAGELRDRRGVVGVEHEVVVRPAPLAPPRDAHDERDADRLLVRPELPAEPVLAPQEPVVAGVDHDRVVEHALAPERAHERADVAVELAQRAQLPSLDVAVEERERTLVVE